MEINKGVSGRRRNVMIAVLGMACALAALCGPSGARAQTAGARFTYELCDAALPGGDPPATVIHAVNNYAPFQNCGTPGGAVGISLRTSVGTGAGYVEVEVPPTPGGFVESETITAFSSLQQSPGSYVAVEGWPPEGVGDVQRSFFLRGEPANCALCAGGNFTIALTCAEACKPGGSIGAHYIAALEVDPIPPTIEKVEGGLLAGGILRGHQSLTATAADEGGGVSVMRALVNGVALPGAVPGTCAVAEVANGSYRGAAAYSPTPCPRTLAASWSLDTAEPPFREGSNTVQVCASDLATVGLPNTTCSTPRSIVVDDSCTESSTAGGQNLSVGFREATSEEITVPFEQSTELAGTLTSGSGSPVSGATICVQAQVEESEGEAGTNGTAVTDAEGHFNYKVPAGPNQHILVGYRHDAFQVARTLAFDSHSKPTIELGRGRVRSGWKVRISGTIPGPRAAGRVVVLQASSLHGKRWITFRRATTGSGGGFRSSYRFGDTPRTTTYRMRAVVPRQAGYPYEAGHSTAKRIKVVGPRSGHSSNHNNGGDGR